MCRPDEEVKGKFEGDTLQMIQMIGVQCTLIIRYVSVMCPLSRYQERLLCVCYVSVICPLCVPCSSVPRQVAVFPLCIHYF
jgi:hypothetical protein